MALTILFVDDEIEMGYLVTNLFKHHGHNIFTAENTDVALELADDIRFDVMVLDVNLGGDDGMKLMTFMHRNHPDVPIILYTGTHHEDAVVQKALENGAHQYMSKGGPLDDLVKAVETAAKRSRGG